MNNVYLQLGTNMGDRFENLCQSISLISQKIGVVIKKSKVYESAPWGVENQNCYLNQVICVKSKFNAFDTLQQALEIEKNMGRIRIEKWGERIIDIDILFYDDKIIESDNLCIPHEFIHKRNFVLMPMCELEPNFVHPKLKKTISELLDESKDEEKVTIYEA